MNDQVYDYADKITLSLSQVIWRVYLKYQKKIISALVRSDSSSQIKQILVELYSELDELNIITFKEIAGRAYGFAKGNKRIDWGEWLFVLLNKPNSVTQYIYTSEVIRKRDRLLEAVLTIKADASANSALDRKAINHAMKRAFSLWYRQLKQYAIDVTDEARVQAFHDVHVRYVKWNAAKDDNVCQQCRERDGIIYDIENVPKKTHYFCRCWLSPVNR